MSDQAACASCADFWAHNHDNHQRLIDQRAALEAAETRIKELADHLYSAWTGIANVSEGDWTNQTEEWQAWAVKWRDGFHALLAALKGGAQDE